tara:strand:- start:15246 stop:15656 length:411 start_codon:yes stop_codon:yes gene_type:complete
MVERVYAEDTKVPVQRSHQEIHKMLNDIGAYQIGILYAGEEGSMIVFKVNGVMYRFSQPDLSGRIKNPQQAERAAWRAMVLLTKAKVTAIKQGISTIEHEFMADTVMPDGSKLGQYHAQLIEHNYSEGAPRLTWAN